MNVDELCVKVTSNLGDGDFGDWGVVEKITKRFLRLVVSRFGGLSIFVNFQHTKSGLNGFTTDNPVTTKLLTIISGLASIFTLISFLFCMLIGLIVLYYWYVLRYIETCKEKCELIVLFIFLFRDSSFTTNIWNLTQETVNCEKNLFVGQ